ncbi:hypothetical protein KIL84_018807 [Mauremys mutica]|uniref:Uncharacterized protein n=1 Tax=Mauremys mutica TaxID=74926 RepID=A0A9D4B9D8_9SAUR|nr:hypothetical protein KIL84_018807 [Mauremys mutica]
MLTFMQRLRKVDEENAHTSRVPSEERAFLLTVKSKACERDYSKLHIDHFGLESLNCTSQVNHNKSFKRKGQICEVLFVFTETSSPTFPSLTSSGINYHLSD